MGSDTFEATVADVQSERETRERDLTRRAGNMYRELVGNGMSCNSASALVHSVFFTDDPKPVTMTFVEHTGVFGLWSLMHKRWFSSPTGQLWYGPKCVVLAELHDTDPVGSLRLVVAEFAPDGTPILEDEASS